MGEQRRLSPRQDTIPSSPDSAQTVQSKSKSKDTKSKMKLSSALGFALVLAIILVILTPEAESKSIRPHRGALARRAMGMGGGRGIRAKMANRKSKKGGRGGRKRSKKARRGKNGRRRGRQDEIPEADVVSDDGGSRDGGDVCEVLMFDRGDGTYSLKFVQNKCE